MLACSFLIKSSGKLLVTRTSIKARLSSILGRIRPLILELLALEWRKFHTFELEYLWSQLANLDQILCVASLGWGKGCIRFWGRLTLAHWTQMSDRCHLGYLFFISLKTNEATFFFYPIKSDLKFNCKQKKKVSVICILLGWDSLGMQLELAWALCLGLEQGSCSKLYVTPKCWDTVLTQMRYAVRIIYLSL